MWIEHNMGYLAGEGAITIRNKTMPNKKGPRAKPRTSACKHVFKRELLLHSCQSGLQSGDVGAQVFAIRAGIFVRTAVQELVVTPVAVVVVDELNIRR